MDIMTPAKFHFNQLMLTLSLGIRASEPPRALRTTEKAGPDRVKKQNRFGFTLFYRDITYWFSSRCVLKMTELLQYKALDVECGYCTFLRAILVP